MAEAEAELRVCMDNGKVVCVEKIQDDTSIQQYIQYKCAASGREVSHSLCVRPVTMLLCS